VTAALDCDYRRFAGSDGWQERWTTGTSSEADICAGVSVRRQHVATPTRDPRDMIAAVTAALEHGAPHVIGLRPTADGQLYPLADWVIAPLPALCERESYALAVDYGDAAPALGEVAEFARLAPEVPLLVHGDSFDGNPGIWRLLDRCPNILLQVTAGASAEVLGEAVADFGAHRFVYGSRTGSVTRAELFSELADADRAAVLGGNAALLDQRKWRDSYL
jgi:hypothetical protein